MTLAAVLSLLLFLICTECLHTVAHAQLVFDPTRGTFPAIDNSRSNTQVWRKCWWKNAWVDCFLTPWKSHVTLRNNIINTTPAIFYSTLADNRFRLRSQVPVNPSVSERNNNYNQWKLYQVTPNMKEMMENPPYIYQINPPFLPQPQDKLKIFIGAPPSNVHSQFVPTTKQEINNTLPFLTKESKILASSQDVRFKSPISPVQPTNQQLAYTQPYIISTLAPAPHNPEIVQPAISSNLNLDNNIQFKNAQIDNEYSRTTSNYPFHPSSVLPKTRVNDSTSSTATTFPQDFDYQESELPVSWKELQYSNVTKSSNETEHNIDLIFKYSVEQLQRKFYLSTYNRLRSISPENRQENGISFVQSALFLQLALVALSTEVDTETKKEIDEATQFDVPYLDKISTIARELSSLPKSNADLKLRYSSHLILGAGMSVSWDFRDGAARALNLEIHHFNGTESPEEMTDILNEMVEKDSGGTMRDTFEVEEMEGPILGVLLTTLYVRGRWRAAPTLLNNTHTFMDDEKAPVRSTRMIRVNDFMRYGELTEWDAEALEISYATPGLKLLLLVPRGRSLRRLAQYASEINLQDVIDKMYDVRVAVTLPLYTLRMTLLLPSKLENLGIHRLINKTSLNGTNLRLSHAVQRLMFWAEAGRHAFKDDGIEWEERPEMELVVDRPYLFYVRWGDTTLINGNFVL